MTDTNLNYNAPTDLDLSNCSASDDGGKTSLTLSQIVSDIKSNTASLSKSEEAIAKVDALEDKINDISFDNVVLKDTAFQGNGYSKLDGSGSFVGNKPYSDGVAYRTFGVTLNADGSTSVNPNVLSHQATFHTTSSGIHQYITETIWNNQDASKDIALKSFTGKAYHPAYDGLADLGLSGNAWNNIFSKTAITVTSDENFKKPVETNVSIADILYKSLDIQTYKLNDAIASKGDDARIHIGFFAQHVQKALSDAGVDPSQIALWVENPNITYSIENKNGGMEVTEAKVINKKDIHSIQSLRYEELLCSLFQGAKNHIQILEQENTDLKARLDVIEKKLGV